MHSTILVTRHTFISIISKTKFQKNQKKPKTKNENKAYSLPIQISLSRNNSSLPLSKSSEDCCVCSCTSTTIILTRWHKSGQRHTSTHATNIFTISSDSSIWLYVHTIKRFAFRPKIISQTRGCCRPAMEHLCIGNALSTVLAHHSSLPTMPSTDVFACLNNCWFLRTLNYDIGLFCYDLFKKAAKEMEPLKDLSKQLTKGDPVGGGAK